MPNDKSQLSLEEYIETHERVRALTAQWRAAWDALFAAEEMARFVLPAMESAWYELEPGDGVMGDQFIRQNDMQKRIEKVRAYLIEFCGGKKDG